MKPTTAFLLLYLVAVSICAAQQKKDAASYFDEGEEAMDENKYKLALAKFNECLRLDPYYIEAYHGRASAKEGLGDAKGALTDYSIYIESRPKADAIFARGVLRYKLGQYLPAREDLLLALRLPAGVTNKVIFRQDGNAGTDKIFTLQSNDHADIFSYLGLVETRLKNYGLARVYIDSALTLSPSEPHYYVNRGIIREHLQDTTGAISDYQRALQIDPTEGAAIHNLAVIKRSRGEQPESEKLLDDAILQSPTLPAPYAARAYFRLNHRNLRGALDDYNEVISLNKTDEESWLYRGIVKERLKDTDGAFVDYTEAIALKEDYARAWLARGNLLSKLDRPGDAIEDYSVAITWFAEYGLAFYNRALMYQKLSKMKEACQDLLEAERLNVSVPVAVKEKICK